MAEFVKVEREGAVALLTIDRPPVNALSAAVLAELESELERLEADAEVCALLVRGGGARAFVAGADITEFPKGAAPTGDGSARGLQRVADRFEASPKPIVAAIHGYCLGGGLELALACDVRVAAEDAQLGQPEIKLGLLPGGGGTQRLPRVIGPNRANLLNFTGDPISGVQAYEWGLVEQVVPTESLGEAGLALAAKLAAQSPHAIAQLKAVARKTRDLPLTEGLKVEAAAFASCLASADGQEGVAAFLEKRQPVWSGT